MKIVTPKQMKILEATADSNGTSYEQLMLNAGNILARRIKKHFKPYQDTKVVFLCGNGNNSGDCFVSAKYLSDTYNNDITIAMLCGEPKTELSKKTFNEVPKKAKLKITYDLQSIKDAISTSDIVCDGIFGTGFHGELPQSIQKVLSTPTDAYIIAVDIPSGIDCYTGNVSSGTLRADETLTFAFKKLGMISEEAIDYCGEIKVADIGITEEHYKSCIENSIQLLDSSNIRLPYRSNYGHKGTFGRLLHITGSKNMVGACIMASKSALRCGVGLLTICTESHDLLPLAMPEPIYINQDFDKVSKELKKSTGILIGCGLGTSEKSVELFKYVVQNAECPLIIDADGINILSNCIDIIKNKQVILTPHPLEMARLTKTSVNEVQSNRLEVALNFAKEYSCIVILKGANTVITDGTQIFIDTVANSGMSKGGSGDVLAGIVSSFVAQGLNLLEACKLSVYIHSQSGLNCADRLSTYSMLPTDVIEEIPNVIKHIDIK